jgi:predicted MFS family arabinose efflux permease
MFLILGLTSDFSKNYLGFPRSYCLSLVAFLFIVSQVLTATIDDIGNLWKATALVGLAYGSIFGLFPTMAIEWFGLCESFTRWSLL